MTNAINHVADAQVFQRPAKLLQKLIRFDTTNPPGRVAPLVGYVHGVLAEAGIDTRVLACDEARPNLVARLPGQGLAPPLLMYGHVDVVTTDKQDWAHPPFEGVVADGYVWGRGALDMKGGIVMMLCALLRARAEGLVPAGDVLLALVSDEETQGDFGARYLVESHAGLFRGVRYAVGEFGGFTLYLGGSRLYPIMVAEKQLCWMRAIVRGECGHGSMPVRGQAMAKLARVLARLDRHKLPVHVTPPARQMIEAFASVVPFPQDRLIRQLLNPRLTDRVLALMGATGALLDPLLHDTVSPTILHASDKINVIPGQVVVELDGRLLPGRTPDQMLPELQTLVGDDVELVIHRFQPGPHEADMGMFDLLGGILREQDPGSVPTPLLLAGVTDACHFSRLGIQTYGFTPMKLPPDFGFMRSVHGPDERIPVEALGFGADAMYRLIQRYGDAA
ncbi:M20/M25/M40 family metallo-hydrolase [Chloroflexota bacterium]